MLRLPDGKGRGKQIGEAVQGALARLKQHPQQQAEDQTPISADQDEVERLAQAIRQQAESAAQQARARLWDVAQEGDLEDPYEKALLLDAIEDYEQIPAYYEALFRAKAERLSTREEEEIDVIEGVAKPVSGSDADDIDRIESEESEK